MKKLTMGKEEKKYLAGYNIADYERPSIAADIAIFSIMNSGDNEDIRKLQKKSLKILLIKRETYPYKSCWALPGGFCVPGEDVKETAKRELYEETNVKNAYLELVDVYGEKNRDPRGWIISNTFMALMDGELCNLRAGTDAWEAEWFSVNIEECELKRIVKENKVNIDTKYTLCLENEAKDLQLKAVLVENKKFHKYHESATYDIVENDQLAFDHAKIVLSACLRLKKDVKDNLKTVFDLMPEYFTLTQLQNTFEIILNEKLTAANFRRKIADYVIETDKIIDGTGYRPAKLFRRNLEAFY